MPLVPAKCTSCGDVIQVDKEKEAAVCPSCGSAFIVEKAINNYGTIIAAETVNIHISDGVTMDSLLESALDHLSRDERREAVSNLDEAMKRSKLGPLFKELRLVLGTICRARAEHLSNDDLWKATDAFHRACVVWKDKSDSTVSADDAGRIFTFISKYVHEAWEAFVRAVPTLLRDEKIYAGSRAVLFQCVGWTRQMIEWGKSERWMKYSEVKSAPLLCRSYWACKGIMILCSLSACYFETPVPSAEEVQKIYDISAELDSCVGEFYSGDLPSRLIPLEKGGEGVHIRRLKKTKNGKEVITSVCEREYFSEQYKLKKPTDSCSGSCGGFVGLIIAVFIIGSIGMNTRISAQALGVMAVVVPVTLAIVAYLLFDNTSSQTKALKKVLYDEWSKSPVHGTSQQRKSLEEFIDWLGVEKANT